MEPRRGKKNSMIDNNHNGPAEIHANGNEIWCKNEKWYRIDGPSNIYIDGAELWFENNKWHRTDGPAGIYSDGNEVWLETMEE